MYGDMQFGFFEYGECYIKCSVAVFCPCDIPIPVSGLGWLLSSFLQPEIIAEEKKTENKIKNFAFFILIGFKGY
jgi:hypothetical protein